MRTAQIRLPVELIQAAGLQPSQAITCVARLLALEAFREGKITLGRAADLCGTPLAEFMDFAADRGVPPLSYTTEDLEEDRQTSKRLGI